ncbi:MAG: hypothetical protein FJ144_18535 [Deltaproteobacteria bacterium]|nr:hypothetical protein [Deltaproteobacteria bacterium]
MVCFWFAAIGAFDDVLGRTPLPARALVRTLPLAVVVLAWTFAFASQAPLLRADWESYRSVGTRRLVHPGDAAARELCGALEPDAVVASEDPWHLHLWCGNAGVLLPRDLETADLAERWLARKRPGYVIADGSPELRFLECSARLEPVARSGENTAYRFVGAPPESRPWRAPPAPARLGGSQSS